jgi:hypothetical protein
VPKTPENESQGISNLAGGREKARIELTGYTLVSSRKVQQVEKPKILFTTRSLRSLEITESTEKKQ